MLAGLPQAPSRFDPFDHPERARARRNAVLRALRATGEISSARYETLAAKPLGLHRGSVYRIRRAPTFFAYVRAQLAEVYGEERIRRGGLRIYTTVVPRDQQAAKRAIRSTLGRRGDPASAIASVDPRTGAIRALVGIVPGKTMSFNLPASARPQAGSAFKTFVLAEAIRRGINPYATRYRSAPFEFRTASGAIWRPRTYCRTYGGVETLVQATLRSDNIVFAKLTLDLGPRSVARLAHRLGVRSRSSRSRPSGSARTPSRRSAWRRRMRAVRDPPGRARRREGRRPPLVEAAAARAHARTGVLGDEDPRGQRRPWHGDGRATRPQERGQDRDDERLDGRVVRGLHTAPLRGRLGGRRAAAGADDLIRGIHVAGGTFPARMWARYARVALAHAKPADWLQPAAQRASWRAWHGRRRYVAPPPQKKPTPDRHRFADRVPSRSGM